MRADALTFRRAKRLRRAMTLPEVLLWQELRPLRFRRQHPVGPYVLDFYHVAGRLAVEVDGAGHDNPEQAAHDRRRDAWLGRQGIRVLRVAAVDVLDDGLRADVVIGVAGMVKVARFEGGALRLAPSTASRSPSPAVRGRITQVECGM